ncbi:ABC transporter ATP-binding protein [Marinobacterium zhoushanense]|uniref:ABC transporter ATP-binding protein n=1 Tax=Marinobacterium zhoushanense TaxID=1679163 RepID=A0ABQ1KEM7_9GAMM|nr:ATP-binding cassette domain-containing protein [Marinobacterium zhoushanense]GGB93210.1 ABC transporter ATP-binding protein [Marinobacterium zhoushanense]
MLELRLESKAYDRSLLGPLTIKIEPGQRLALIGPSGCGKTTLLNILSGLDSDYIGVRYVQRDDLLIAYMFQEPRLLPWRTVAQNLVLAGVSPDAVDSALSEVGLHDVAGLYPRQLSLGMARRVALARALAIKPDLLLLDEPLVSLDPQMASQLRQLLKKLLAERPWLSMVLVSHDPVDARELADSWLSLDFKNERVLLPSEEKTASAG